MSRRPPVSNRCRAGLRRGAFALALGFGAVTLAAATRDEELAAQLRELAVRRTQALTDREPLARRLGDVRRSPAQGADSTEAEEGLITKDEDLRAIALRVETAENSCSQPKTQNPEPLSWRRARPCHLPRGGSRSAACLRPWS